MSSLSYTRLHGQGKDGTNGEGKLNRPPLFGLSGKTKNGNPFLDHTKDQLQLH